MFDALAGIELAFAFGSPSGILEASPAELAIVLRDNELAAEMAPCWWLLTCLRLMVEVPSVVDMTSKYGRRVVVFVRLMAVDELLMNAGDEK